MPEPAPSAVRIELPLVEEFVEEVVVMAAPVPSGITAERGAA
jgi:hypothetical protein